MTILVSGSLALDHIMVFPDRFKDHILPDKLHILNVSFNIDSLRTHFGGVAGNIAYHLRLLGEDPLIVATGGSDFGPYAEWLDRHGIRRDGIRILGDLRTAQGFVTTDLDDNQIWAFYVGAMGRAHEAPLPPAEEPLRLAIVSSDSREAMLARARELTPRGGGGAGGGPGRPAGAPPGARPRRCRRARSSIPRRAATRTGRACSRGGRGGSLSRRPAGWGGCSGATWW